MTSEARTVEKFIVHCPVMDDLAEDVATLEIFRRDIAPQIWVSHLATIGAMPAGVPTVTESDNLQYGAPIMDPDTGLQMTGTDGAPVTDHVKIIVRISGPAIRGVHA